LHSIWSQGKQDAEHAERGITDRAKVRETASKLGCKVENRLKSWQRCRATQGKL
ncbi:hypothetical protein KI387_038075, partial [Taxus chinensis]